MAYPFPVERYRDFQGWIPETDIDGIDSKKEYMADCENIDYENGFISNAITPIEYSLPTEVSALIVTGYELLTAKFFRHTERGICEFYCLYYLDTGHRLKFFVKDSTGTYELNIDEQNDDILIAGKPVYINYSLVNNQLKVNLNSGVIYESILEGGFGLDTYLNLTLCYLEETTYYDDTAPTPLPLEERAEGWYLFPRWIGWTYQNVTLGTDTEIVEDFDDGTFDNNTFSGSESWTYNAAAINANITSTGSMSFTAAGSAGDVALITFNNIKALKAISFELAHSYQPVSYTVIISGASGSGPILDSPTGTLLASGSIDAASFTEVVIDLNVMIQWQNITDIDIQVRLELLDTTAIEVGNVVMYPFTDIAVLVKNFDQQRNLLISDGILNILTDTEISIRKTDIDWRVQSYEIYFPGGEGSSIYYLTGKLDLSAETPPEWTDAGTTLTAVVTDNLIDTTADDYALETLNFNYGLGTSVRVHEKKRIYNEVFYRGRAYYVNGTEKFYYSHLSGTGLAQPDSFPYSEEPPFGYNVSDAQAVNKALAVTPLDELVVLGDQKDYVYYIQNTGGIPLRTVKAINGGAGISSAKSLAVDLTGQPVAEVLFWIDEQGAYIYGGGRAAPKSVTDATHKNYWIKELASAYKDDAITVYNKNKKEFWVQIGSDLIIYELPYNRFKKYNLGFNIVEDLGMFNNILYVLTDNDKIYKVDPSHNGVLAGSFRTHYTTNTLIMGQYPISSWEWQHKIMQDIYVAFKDKASGSLTLTILSDENEIDPSIIFSTNQLREVVPSPLLVRYGKMALKIELNKTLSKVKEFGYSFSVPSQGVGGFISQAVKGIGMDSGSDAGIGL